MKEIEYKNEISKIRELRVESERKMISLDSALQTQLGTNDKIKEDHHKALSKLMDDKEEIKMKLDWYMENQDIIGEDRDLLKQREGRIDELKEEMRNMKSKDGGRKKVTLLEKQVRDLQEALKKRNPDSLPLLLESVKPSIEEQDEYRRLQQENEKLKRTLQDKDNEFDQKIRNLRVEIDKMKIKYEKNKSASLPEDVKDQRITDLERQVQETKDYYIERMKESKGNPDRISQIKGDMKSLKEIEVLKKELNSITKTKKKMDKEIRSLKQSSKNSSPSLSGAINTLLKKDYLFCICGLYKQAMHIKDILERKGKFEDCLDEVEGLVDQFDISSQKYKTNKATILFSKVTDK
ncbi:MAG: hypothetical protein Q9P44_10670 [Anaerolineae bacterium]|nr:hypothetical protein [Anaerolineae bacterium]